MSKRPLSYHVSGTVVQSVSGRPITGLRVRAYDKAFSRDQLLGDGYTDESGHYEIAFNQADFAGPLVRVERHPEIVLLVLEGNRQIYSTERSFVIDADRETSIDLRIPYFIGEERESGTANLFGIAVNLPEAAGLSAEEVLEAYRLIRGGVRIEQAERFRRVFPGLFGKYEEPRECGNGIYELFRYLMQERNALHLLADADADPYSGATVHQFFTANIVVKYTTDATLPDGTANPNQLPPRLGDDSDRRRDI